MKSEWKSFEKEVASPSAKAPTLLADRIFSRVRAELRPSVPRVLAKLGLFHAIASIGTLSICPQFGFRLFGDGMGLMEQFMALGTFGCAAACGTFFLGSSLGLSAVFFSRPEWRAIRNHPVLTLTALMLPSFGFFEIMDGEFFLDFSIAWILGALLTGWVMIEGVWRLKYSEAAARA
jgi:hypothetical protein